MALWRDDRGPRSDRYGGYDPIVPLGYHDVLGDFDREFRRMNRDLNRLEQNVQGGFPGNQLASLIDRGTILPNIIVDQNGQRQTQFQFDTRGFKPDDITIKTENGNKLVVSAKHEDKSEHHHHVREFRRLITIPEGVNFDQMQSRLSPQGVLTIQAPYNPPAIQQSQDRVLPIKHETGTDVTQKK
jgi:HSP20 family molecular chaperone IbpA